MRCLGLTKSLKRCRNHAKLLTCRHHWRQPFVLFLITFPAILSDYSQLYNDYLKPLINSTKSEQTNLEFAKKPIEFEDYNKIKSDSFEKQDSNKIKPGSFEKQVSNKIVKGIKATISEYYIDWEKLADKILEPFGGLSKFTTNSYNKFDLLSPKDRDLILKEIPDFIEKINSLYNDWRFSSDNLRISREIVTDIKIEYNYKDIFGFEFKRGNSLRTVNFDNIKEMQICYPCLFEFRTGKSSGYYPKIDIKYYPNIDIGTSTPRDIGPIAEVMFWDGITENMQLVTENKKIKGKSDFGDFEMDISRGWDWEKNVVKIVFERKSEINK